MGRKINSIKVIDDPEAFQLMSDGTRRRIVQLLQIRQMSVSQLATELNLTPQTVHHHMKRLIAGGIVWTTREERFNNVITASYSLVANTFYFTFGPEPTTESLCGKITEEQMVEALRVLRRFGFDLKRKYDKNKIAQLIDAHSKYLEGRKDANKFTTDISRLVGLDCRIKTAVQNLAKVLLMSEEEFKQQLENKKEFRGLALSLLQK